MPCLSRNIVFLLCKGHEFRILLLRDRKEADRACSISVSIEADVINREEWEKIARFHAEMTKQLADYAFYPYVQELKALDNTF